MLIGKTHDEAMLWLAMHMNLNPDKSDWPVEWMERLLKAADAGAERFIRHEVQQAHNPYYRCTLAR
jgi:hypothetical protein